jgi:hypothetical protein
MYSHTSVVSRPNAANHVIAAGAPAFTPVSITAKSRIRFSAATMQIRIPITIPVVVGRVQNSRSTPKIAKIQPKKYMIATPRVAMITTRTNRPVTRTTRNM